MHTLKSLLALKPSLLWPQPPSKKAADIKEQVLGYQAAPLAELRKAWKDRYGEPVPAPSSKTLLLRLLVWRLQADAFGGHTSAVLKILNAPLDGRRKASAPPGSGASLTVGTLLKRDWGGQTHHVTVTKEGFGHNGKVYKTLTEAAYAITGTKWSGPRFFGLKDTKGQPRKIAR